jgi:hypothetical protein
MLRSNQELEKYVIGASDGSVGRVKDFYFDDRRWVVRYLVVDTEAWLPGRKVLISPYSVGVADDKAHVLPVSITKQQVKDSPSIDWEKPVSRQHEIQYLGYYGYPYYWGGAGLWGEGAYPGMMMTGVGYGGGDLPYRDAEATEDRAADPHLRSCEALTKYHVHASDGDIGHVQAFLIDEQSWAIRYVVVNTSNWWVGHAVLIAPEWIEDVSWSEGKLTVNLTRVAVQEAPPYDANVPLDRDAEVGIYKHYGQTGYWIPAAAARRVA